MYRQSHLMHLLHSLLLYLRVVHVVTHLSIVLVLVLVRKAVPASREHLVHVSLSSGKLRICNLLIVRLHRDDAQSRVLHGGVELAHFLLSVQVRKVWNRAVNVHRFVEIDRLHRIWHRKRFHLRREIVNMRVQRLLRGVIYVVDGIQRAKMHILVGIKRINILVLNDIVDRKNSSYHKVTHLRMHWHRIDAYRYNGLSVAHLQIAQLLALLLLQLIDVHKLVHLVYSDVIGHPVNLLQAVEAIHVLVLLVEQLMLIITTHWELIQLVGSHASQLVSPWLLVLYSVHVLLHKHLVVRVYYIPVIYHGTVLVFLLS